MDFELEETETQTETPETGLTRDSDWARSYSNTRNTFESWAACCCTVIALRAAGQGHREGSYGSSRWSWGRDAPYQRL